MKPPDRKAADLRDIFRELIKQFKKVHSAAATGSHTRLNNQELRVIEYVGEHGHKIMRELGEELGVAVNTVTGIVDELEAKKLVSRQKSSDDRRIIRVELTPAGQEIYQEATDLTLRFMEEMLGALTEQEQEVFMGLFHKIGRATRWAGPQKGIATSAG